jgi:pyridoxal 5'-phosphate synthase pdxS subunit
MDVTTPQEAQIAERAGAVAVMALHAVPADIRKAGGVARMADPQVIAEIIDAVTIPVMAKARIGHFVEAEILEALGVDMVDESEVLTPADESFHIDKTGFTIPFVCGARDLGEALRRIHEGAAMIRTKGEAGTGDVKEAVRHMRAIMGAIRELKGKSSGELSVVARKIEASVELVKETAELQRLPVVNFAAGGIATPADAALMMRLGADGVFVGSGIFKAENPEKMASAIVEAVNNYDNATVLAQISKGLGGAMKGIDIRNLTEKEVLQARGW